MSEVRIKFALGTLNHDLPHAPQIAVYSFLVFLFARLRSPQDKPDKPTPENVAQAEAVIKRGIEAYGGSNYINMKTVVGRGFIRPFRRACLRFRPVSSTTLLIPTGNARNLRKRNSRYQTNSGDTGWLYDGGPKTISDMKPSQIEDFKRGMRTASKTCFTVVEKGRRHACLRGSPRSWTRKA